MADAIKYESALPALLTQLMGTTQKTNGGGGTGTTSSTTTSSANTDPLMSIFGQQAASATPEGMQSMLTDLFTRGAQAVPGLTQQFANSSGSRVQGNSGLNLALGELTKTLAQQAAELMMRQQQAAGSTAAQIAQATAGKTTTGATTAPATSQTVQTGNPTAALLTGLGGVGLNAADKLGLFKGLKGAVSGGTATGGVPFEANFPASGVLSDAAGGLSNPSYDVSNVASFSGNGDQFGNYGESLAGFGDASSAANAGSGAFDSLMDSGSMLFDGLSNTISDAGTQVADAAGNAFDDFSSWFADGGLVKVESLMERRKRAMAEAEGAANSGGDANETYQKTMAGSGGKDGSKEQPVKKADGGVIRNKNNMGAPISRGMGSSAMNFNGQPQQSITDVASSPAAGSPSASGTSGNSGNSLTTGQLQSNPELLMKLLEKETGASALAGPNSTVGTPSQNAAVVGGIMTGLAGLGPLGALGSLGAQALTGNKSIQSLAIDALMGELGLKSRTPGLTASGLGDSAAGPGEADPGIAAGTTDALTGFLGLNDNFGTGSSDFGGHGSNDGTAGGGAANGGIGGSAGDANSGAGGMGGGDGSGSGGGDATAADGGKMDGPGSGISDSIHARLSDGEYVLSKDVVDIVGVPFLDSLQHRFHTPAAIQRMQRGG